MNKLMEIITLVLLSVSWSIVAKLIGIPTPFILIGAFLIGFNFDSILKLLNREESKSEQSEEDGE